MAKIQLLTQEQIEQEEREAQERGLTIFQLRQYKKARALREEKRLNALRAKMKEKAKIKAREVAKLKRLKAKEKADKQRLIEKLKAKEDKKKQRLKLKHEQEKLVKRRKPGRPKKRGRKRKYYVKKKRKVTKTPLPPYRYKIVICRNGKQIQYVDRFRTTDDAYARMNELVKESEKVIIPSRMIHRNEVKDVVYEYLILERNFGDKENAMLRNEFGKLVEHKTTSKDWVIFDKAKFNVEETFWVWGYNNKTDRKDFSWIYNNLLVPLVETKYDAVRVMLYKNKVVIKNDRDELEMVICKCVDDAVRVYNKMEEFVKRDKIKQIFFMGSYSNRGERKTNLENEIMELTGWDKSKVQMSSTSKHVVNEK